MKILLINNDSMVTKLFEASAKKLGLELVVQNELEVQDIEEKLFLFVDEGIEGDFEDFIKEIRPILSCFLHKYSTPKKEGFDNYIRKPFLPTEILDILKPKLTEMGITEATTSDITKDQLEDLSQTASMLRQHKLEDIDDLESLELNGLDDLMIDKKALVDSKESFEEFDKANLPEYSLDDLELEDEGFDLSDLKEQEIQVVDKVDKDKKDDEDIESESKESEKIDFDLEGQHQDDFINQDISEETFVPHKEDIQDIGENKETENQDEVEVVLETQDSQNDFEKILDKHNDLSILDKNQVDEVKKILEQTDKKSIAVQQADEIEDFEGIDEKDIISALNDEEIADSKPFVAKEKINKQIVSKTSKKKTSKHPSKKTTQKDLDISSLENIQELIKNMPLETLQTIFNGAQLTINISFPNQEKSNKKK